MPLACPIPADWSEAIAAILRAGSARALVLGPVNAGKSTFCRLLLREAASRGRAAALIDADVGQKLVGPPACLTRAASPAPEHLAGLAFVGSTDPVAGFGRILSGLPVLVAEASEDLLVVNTSGLLAGAGRRLKTGKIERLAPDLIVAIGQDAALDAILADHAATPRLRLAPAPGARRKSPARRRTARREAFRAYFAGAESHAIALPAPQLAALPERLLVGVTGRDGRDAALGLIERLDAARGAALVLTPAPAGALAGLVPGAATLDDTWEARAFRGLSPEPMPGA